MKLLNLDPVTDESIPDMLEYIGKYLSPDTVLDSWIIPTGPLVIESEHDEVFSAPEVVKLCIKAEKEGFDGVFVNCFGDPGVRAARELVNIPVFGGFEPVMHLTMGLADQIGIITVLPAVVPLIRGSINRANLSQRVACLRTVNIPVQDLQNYEILIPALVEQCVLAIEKDGAEAIVLGCTAMIDVAQQVKEILLTEKGYDLPVAEAAQSALTLLELNVRMGLLQSRVTYEYAKPLFSS